MLHTQGSLPLRPALLGRQAVESRAYAKALHYVEEEFHEYFKTEKVGVAKHSQSTGMELMEKLIRYLCAAYLLFEVVFES